MRTGGNCSAESGFAALRSVRWNDSPRVLNYTQIGMTLKEGLKNYSVILSEKNSADYD